MTALRILAGLLFGGAFGFLFHWGILLALGLSNVALWVGLAAGGVGLVFGIVASAMDTYGVRFFSWVGFVLDTSWSLLNTFAGLVVWLPACAAKGNRTSPTPQTQRSGCIVYNQNPRGGPYGATTVGTVIGGGWDSHEEIHVWQARLFGAVYGPTYLVSWLFNVLGRLVLGRVSNISFDAYRRIIWEDWAYLGGTHGANIRWGRWVLGLLLTLFYLGLLAFVPIAFALITWWAGLIGIGAVLVYSIVRAAI